MQTGIGPVTVKVPKVRSKDGKPVTFRSALVPPYVRKANSIGAELPWLHLKGISTGEIVIQGIEFVNGIKPSTQEQAAS